MLERNGERHSQRVESVLSTKRPPPSPQMKDISEIHAHIMDAGTFSPLADAMARKCRKVTYHSPFEAEYLDIKRCCLGDGMDNFERVDEYMEPEFFDSVDLWIFPDIGYGGLQRYLRREKKLVWGSMGASDLELYRTRFIKVIEELGLPLSPSVPIRGLTALAEHLKPLKNKWVKINRYRENKETFKWIDWTHGARHLEEMAVTFGPLKEYVWFVVQDPIDGDEEEPVLEMGYDGWLITSPDGKPIFPESSFQGYEKKNQLYLGSLLNNEDLPEDVRMVNDAFGPVNAEYGYRNFIASEIRKKGQQKGKFIDPTERMAGMTQEHLLNACTNLPEIILDGAQGIYRKPEWKYSFSAEATLHYTDSTEDGWKTFVVPEEARDNFKLYRCCYADGAYQFPPHKSDELGVVVGGGDSIEEAIENLKENFEAVKDEPVSIEVAGFADLLEQIQDAEKGGVEFSDQPVPKPEIALS